MPAQVQIRGLAEFNAQLEKFSRDLPAKDVPNLQRKIAFEVLSRVVRKTPVDTGRARGNWQTTINYASETENWQTNPIGNGAAVLAGEIPQFAVVWVSNNVVYILPLENGHSKQAPHGMVAVTIEELRAIFP